MKSLISKNCVAIPVRKWNMSNTRYYKWTHRKLGKIRAPDGIQTHDPPWIYYRCSNPWAIGDSMVSKGEMWEFDSSCITQPQSQIATDSIAHNCIVQSHWSIIPVGSFVILHVKHENLVSKKVKITSIKSAQTWCYEG